MAAISSLVKFDTQTQSPEPSDGMPPGAQETSQTARLETIGRLASGVAHDFANILTLISGYAEILLERDSSGALHGHAELEEIRRASNRGAKLIGQLLHFARTRPAESKPIVLNSVATDVERMLRPIIGEMIEVRLKLSPGLGQTLADPVEMDQVVMNLLLNARDAMPSGGAITIETENSELDPVAAAALEMQAGPCVTLRISDTGRGIAPDAMVRLFDPFFSTKPVGKGAGIGLSNVRQIVRRSHGAVWATSELGSGATFHVCLPRMPEHHQAADPQTERLTPQRGNETVLLVEDEESVRRLLSQVLSMRGYHVIEASDGERGLELFAQHGSEINLVLTDVIMPRLTGVEMAEKLLESRPDIPVIFMSGYPDDQLSAGSAIRAGRRFLRKPLLPDALSNAVREALDSPSRPFDCQ